MVEGKRDTDIDTDLYMCMCVCVHVSLEEDPEVVKTRRGKTRPDRTQDTTRHVTNGLVNS